MRLLCRDSSWKVACAETKVLPHAVGVELELGLVNHPQGIELIGQRTLPHHELGRVGSIQTVHTVGPQHTSLKQQRRTFWYCLSRFCCVGSVFFSFLYGLLVETHALFPRKSLIWLPNAWANFQSRFYFASQNLIVTIRNDLTVSQELFRNCNFNMKFNLTNSRGVTMQKWNMNTQMEKKKNKQTWTRPLAVTCPPRSPHLKHSSQIKKNLDGLVGAQGHHCNHIIHINAEKHRKQEQYLSFSFF